MPTNNVNVAHGDNVLPDSRTKERSKGRVGAKPGPMGLMWVPVYCANCGVPYGYVPEENCTFACWLCNECSETHGTIAGTMMMPDEVMWQKITEEQLDKYGRILGQEELYKILDENNSPLAKLYKEKIKVK